MEQPERLVLTFARVWISSPALLLYLLLRRFPLRLHCRRDYGAMALLGALWAAHWVTFLHSAQAATVAIATITFSTYPVFVTFFEPWLFRERLRPSAVIQALIMLAGAAVLVPGGTSRATCCRASCGAWWPACFMPPSCSSTGAW